MILTPHIHTPWRPNSTKRVQIVLISDVYVLVNETTVQESEWRGEGQERGGRKEEGGGRKEKDTVDSEAHNRSGNQGSVPCPTRNEGIA